MALKANIPAASAVSLAANSHALHREKSSRKTTKKYCCIKHSVNLCPHLSRVNTNGSFSQDGLSEITNILPNSVPEIY